MEEDRGGMGDAATGGTKDGEVRSSLTSEGDSASADLKAMGYDVEVDEGRVDSTNSGTSVGKYALYFTVALIILVILLLIL